MNAIAKHHEAVWNGEPWYGTNCKDGLAGITPAQATYRISNQHNIAEILKHMCQWKKFVIEKLKGNPDFDIELNSLQDWARFDNLDGVAWSQLVDEFNGFSQTLTEQIGLQQDTLLEQKVPGRKYDFYSLVQGITEHDIYHLGQILVLKKIAIHEI